VILYGVENPRVNAFYLSFWRLLHFFFLFSRDAAGADSRTSLLELAAWSRREIPNWEINIPGDVTYSLMNGAAKTFIIKMKLRSFVIRILEGINLKKKK